MGAMMVKKEFIIMKVIKLLEILRSILLDPQTLNVARFSKKFFTRVRKMPFCDVLVFFLDMKKTSLQTRLNVFFKRGNTTSMSEQAFSKARSLFDHSPFVTMVRELVKAAYGDPKDMPTWEGYHVLAEDGSYLQLPKNDGLRAAFGTRGGGGNCVSAGNATLYDVLSGWPIAPSITHTDMNERVECAQHVEYLCSELPTLAAKSILLMDRGYPAQELLKTMEDKGIKFLARCAKNWCKAVTLAPAGESFAVLGNGLRVRVYKFELPCGEEEVLVTNLFNLRCEQLGELYAMRWGIETYYNQLKNVICVEKFSGRTENAIRQDFWASMVLMIATAVFRQEADAIVRQAHEHKDNKHTYRVKTSDLVVTLRDHFIFNVLRQKSRAVNKAIQNIMLLATRSLSPVRPGRSFPRRPPSVLACNDNLKSHL